MKVALGVALAKFSQHLIVCEFQQIHNLSSYSYAQVVGFMPAEFFSANSQSINLSSTAWT